ncbi:MAG: radical SAM family heme chaperone HemW [Bryobacteraceae bacterium]|nr:radical SAM family heme chaperone HemW [Bryobacteraceae bacterium]
MPGVYISYPFCGQKCSFCNFASGVFSADLEREYVNALVAEIRSFAFPWHPETVYIGGGTPSRTASADLLRILGAVPGNPWREATLEAAPGSLTPEAVDAWVSAGINRVSLGVQSFMARELASTGRRHDAATAEADCQLLRSRGIAEINIDLIVGLPHQTELSLVESLDWIERLQPPHVSVYLFEVDEDSRLGLEVLQGGRKYSASSVPDGDRMAGMYQLAVDRLETLGIHRYEISNFARPGSESRHNLKYWQLEPYVGFGADAHSFLNGLRWGNVETAAEYVARWQLHRPPALDATLAIPEDEKFFVGLRLMNGVPVSAEDYARYGEAIDRFTEAGLLIRSEDRIALTDRGVLLSNEVCQEFLSD